MITQSGTWLYEHVAVTSFVSTWVALDTSFFFKDILEPMGTLWRVEDVFIIETPGCAIVLLSRLWKGLCIPLYFQFNWVSVELKALCLILPSVLRLLTDLGCAGDFLSCGLPLSSYGDGVMFADDGNVGVLLDCCWDGKFLALGCI